MYYDTHHKHQIENMITAAWNRPNRVSYQTYNRQMFAVRYIAKDQIEFEQLEGFMKRHTFEGRQDAIDNFKNVFKP